MTKLVRGRGLIELRDERGRLAERVPFENFVSAETLRHNKWQVRQDFHPSSTLIGANYTDLEPARNMTHLVLTDNTAAVAPTTETFPSGNIVGWANKTAYSGTDTQRGSINTVESVGTTAFTRWVFDWATTSGNGTFQSVSWGALYDGTLLFDSQLLRTYFTMFSTSGSTFTGIVSYDPVLDAILVYSQDLDKMLSVPRTNADVGGTTSTQLYSRSGHYDADTAGYHSYGTKVDGAGVAHWGYNARDLYKYDKTTGAVVQTYSNALPPGVYSIAVVDASSVWVADNTTSIKRYSVAGALLNTATLPHTVLYVGLDPTTGDVLAQSGDTSSVALSRVTSAGAYVGTGRISPYFGYPGSLCGLPSGEILTSILWGGNQSGDRYQLWKIAPLGARTLLSAPVTKTSAQTMKITYEFDFT